MIWDLDSSSLALQIKLFYSTKIVPSNMKILRHYPVVLHFWYYWLLDFFSSQISVEWIGCLEKRQTKVGKFVDADTKDITNRYEEIIAEDNQQYTLEYKTHLQIGVQVILIFVLFFSNFFLHEKGNM